MLGALLIGLINRVIYFKPLLFLILLHQVNMIPVPFFLDQLGHTFLLGN